MSSYDGLSDRVRQLTEARFKAYEKALIRRKAFAERDAKIQERRQRQRRDFMAAIGTDPVKLDAAAKADDAHQESELAAFLKESRANVANRPSVAAAAAKDAAIRSAVLGQAGHPVLPIFAASVFAPDRSLLAGVVGLTDWTNGAINSGWVFPDDPSQIHIKDTRHYPNALCWDNRWDPFPEFAVHFGFVPATTATYEMTAVLAFHGFYVLRCDDSWWNCRDASVRLDVQMNVHQYTDDGWKDFPLLYVENQNVQEIVSYDRTHFLDYTVGLRAGDPVVVTVKGSVQASAHGAGAYAEPTSPMGPRTSSSRCSCPCSRFKHRSATDP